MQQPGGAGGWIALPGDLDFHFLPGDLDFYFLPGDLDFYLLPGDLDFHNISCQVTMNPDYLYVSCQVTLNFRLKSNFYIIIKL